MKPQRPVSFLTVFLFILPLLFSCDDPAPNEPPEEKVKQWYFLGLESENINAIAVDPQDTDVIYAGSLSDFSAGTVGGIFKTTDGGAVWDTLVRGITVMDIDFHPKNSRTVYVTCGLNALTHSGLLRTDDAGESWTWIDEELSLSNEEGPAVLEIDALHPDTMYLGTAGFLGGGFHRSTDGSDTWTRIDTQTHLSNGVTTIVVDEVVPSMLFVTTGFTGSLMRSMDYGVTWTLLDFPLEAEALGVAYRSQTSRLLCVGATNYGFYFSPDDGLNWTNSMTGYPESSYVRSICSSFSDSLYIAVISPGFASVYSSGIDTLSWQIISDSLSSTINILSLDGNANLYMGTQGVSVYR